MAITSFGVASIIMWSSRIGFIFYLPFMVYKLRISALSSNITRSIPSGETYVKQPRTENEIFFREQPYLCCQKLHVRGILQKEKAAERWAHT
jgi:hypothetical protein